MDIRDRAKAARAYIDAQRGDQEHTEKLELAAFMDIFHPDVPDKKKRSGTDDSSER